MREIDLLNEAAEDFDAVDGLTVLSRANGVDYGAVGRVVGEFSGEEQVVAAYVGEGRKTPARRGAIEEIDEEGGAVASSLRGGRAKRIVG